MRHILFVGFVSLVLIACGDGAKHPSCTPTGTTCSGGAAECCTRHCDDLSGVCARVPGTCVAGGGDCSVGPDCCSFSCKNFKCSGDQCTSDNQSCGDDDECCSGICSEGKCAPLNPRCKTSGNTCSTNSECCSSYCKDGLCNNAPSFCTQIGDACVTDGECCGGLCSKTESAKLGTCALVPSAGAGGCDSMGAVCGDGADYDPSKPLPKCGGSCCSKACFPYGPTGVLICQPPSGCRPAGELCYADADCCGAEGNPDGDRARTRCRKQEGFLLGRCDQGHACAPAGDICRLATTSCNDTDTCCAGNVQNNPEVCRQDSLGIPRCGAGTTIDCTDPSSHAGLPCASSADCCGLPCVYVPGSEVGYVCGSTCVPSGGACTTAADCCSGLPCQIPGGSPEGTCGMPQGCADYGQSCTMPSDCCNGLPCTDGKCQGIIL
jgi:hypothetical protein